MNYKTLIVVLGPTASGKTERAAMLAKDFGCAILSADSRQFYKEMNIGTAKPDPITLKKAPHHFVGHISVQEEYSVGRFEREALTLLGSLFSSSDCAIMVGGSGLYIDAVCHGMDQMPVVDHGVRENLNAQFEGKGISFLQEKLKQLDPEYYGMVDLNNPQRLIRALEICESSGRPYSSFRKKEITKRPFSVIKIGLEIEREQLYERINKRVDRMMEEGLIGEAETLRTFRHLNALQTVGYTEVFGFLDGHYDLEECIRLIKRNTRRYAKRQMTWFGKDESIQWFQADRFEEIPTWLRDRLAGSGQLL